MLGKKIIMQEIRWRFVLIGLLVFLSACGNRKETNTDNALTVSEEKVEDVTDIGDQVLLVNKLIQGTWEYYHEKEGYKEEIKFDNGKFFSSLTYKKANIENEVSEGTYQVVKDHIITSIDGYTDTYDYVLKENKIAISLVPNHGILSNEKRRYFQTQKGELRENYAVSDVQNNSQKDHKENVEKKQNYSPSAGERNALDKARKYLDYSAFSYAGLIDQLEYEGFSHSEAKYGVDNCDVDWKEQAVRKAKQYLEYSSFSYEGLIEQLEYEGFNYMQALHGADNCGADWEEQAAKKAQEYLNHSSFSREELFDQLVYEGFSEAQANYGVDIVY